MAHHSQTITRAKVSRTAIPASTTMAEAKSNIELHPLSCQNAASSLRLDAGDAITLVLLAREGPGHLGTLPVLFPVPSPVPGQSSTVSVRLVLSACLGLKCSVSCAVASNAIDI